MTFKGAFASKKAITHTEGSVLTATAHNQIVRGTRLFRWVANGLVAFVILTTAWSLGWLEGVYGPIFNWANKSTMNLEITIVVTVVVITVGIGILSIGKAKDEDEDEAF